MNSDSPSADDAGHDESSSVPQRASKSTRSPESDTLASRIVSFVQQAQEDDADRWSGDQPWTEGQQDTIDQVSTIDEMVVYLDGQLEDGPRQQLEQQLLEDPDKRQHLADLQQSWDALEALPRSSCSHSFTESTVKLVVQDALRAQPQNSSWRPLIKRTFAVVAASAFLFAGFVTTHYWITRQDRLLLQQMDLIDNWEKYEAIGSLELLERLNQEELFAKELRHATE